MHIIITPIGCASLTGIIVMLLNKALVTLVGNLFSVIICFVTGIFAYYILLIAVRGIRQEEFEAVPGGAFWRKIAEIMHLI